MQYNTTQYNTLHTTQYNTIKISSRVFKQKTRDFNILKNKQSILNKHFSINKQFFFHILAFTRKYMPLRKFDKSFFFIKYNIVSIFAAFELTVYNMLSCFQVQTLSAAAIAKFTSGHVINLVTKDLEPVEPGCLIISYIITVPIQIITVALVLWWLVSWKAVLCVVYTIATIVFQMGMSHVLQNLRFKIMPLNDVRVRLLADMISGIRVLKANAWEWFFKEQIEETRG